MAFKANMFSHLTLWIEDLFWPEMIVGRQTKIVFVSFILFMSSFNEVLVLDSMWNSVLTSVDISATQYIVLDIDTVISSHYFDMITIFSHLT